MLPSSLPHSVLSSHPVIPPAMLPTLGILLTLVYLAAPSKATTNLTIDNVDPRIQYQGSWQMVATSDVGVNADFGGTLSTTNQNSSTATIEFTGTSIAVYGSLRPVGTWNIHSVYYLDDIPVPATYEPNPVVEGEMHQMRFYWSGPIGDGAHKLVIENMGQQLWLDYVAIEVSDDSGYSATSTIPASTSQSPVNLTVSPTSSSTSQQTTSSTALSTSHSFNWPSPPTSWPAHSSPSSSGETLLYSTSPPTATLPPQTSNAIVSGSITQPVANPATVATSCITSSPVATEPSASPTNTDLLTAQSLSPGAIAGITAGGTILLLTLGTVLVLALRRHQRRRACIAVTPFVPGPEEMAEAARRRDIVWSSEKGDTRRIEHRSLPAQLPHGRLLVITHAASSGARWTDYRSSLPDSFTARAL
ncbi:hypothetical protein BV20DRAFT_88192 [Pilatotrama ljubarskyi]|nr:hypothetical protein BV20DRAFT_88192 [Pilatotrama ljubarskyi]